MTDAATLDGQRVSTGVIHVPPVGPWWADLVLEDAPTLSSGILELVVGRQTFRGTVVEAASGVFAERGRVRLVAGAGAWGSLVEVRAYHNDAGVTALQVAQDAATLSGETLGDFSPTVSTVGIDYVRASGPASRALEDAAGGAGWWVGYDGVTVVGTRSTSALDATAGVEVLDFDPVTRIATIALDDLSTVGVGTILPADARLAAAQTVRELRIEVEPDAIRLVAWCGAVAGTRSREALALERIVESVINRRILAPREYRIVQMNGDRVDLQSTAPTLPDLTAISVRGPAGVAAQLTPGGLVLVQWIDGNPARPMITHAIGKDGNAWAPVSLTLDATGASASIKFGANATKALAWVAEIRAELVKIAATLLTGTNSGGAVTWGTPYTAASIPTAASLGTGKTVAE